MKDVNRTMTKSQALSEAKTLFSLYDKINRFNPEDYPFLFNFMSCGRWYLYINKDRTNVYHVEGRLPFHVQWQKEKDKYVDSFGDYNSLKDAKDAFYILGEKLFHQEYTK